MSLNDAVVIAAQCLDGCLPDCSVHHLVEMLNIESSWFPVSRTRHDTIRLVLSDSVLVRRRHITKYEAIKVSEIRQVVSTDTASELRDRESQSRPSPKTRHNPDSQPRLLPQKNNSLLRLISGKPSLKRATPAQRQPASRQKAPPSQISLSLSLAPKAPQTPINKSQPSQPASLVTARCPK